MPNTALLVAAVLVFAVGAVHSWLGERRLLGPLLAPEKRLGLLAKSSLARTTLRFAWHLTTLAWWGLGAVLAGLALSPSDPRAVALIVVAATFLATGLAILAVSRGRHLAWPVLLAIAGLAVAPLL
jgi:hypothetical protein